MNLRPAPLRRPCALPALAAALLLTLAPAWSQEPQGDSFALKHGDRVVFYGDSITDQRMYTLFVEQYAVTRFPQREIRFVHSGWGGDRVTGGGGGPIDLRLDRDVTAYKPTVVSIMLGMNDGSYRTFDDKIFQTYADGYRHLAQKLKKDNPGIRLTFIQPSPFDDVTRPPSFEGGYNAVLVRYGAFLQQLASTEGATVADLNTSVVAALARANAADPAVAQKIIADRVHPGWGGQLLMAEALLKAWNAPALVSAVTIDAVAKTGEGQNATVTDLRMRTDGSLSWKALEGALPFPALPPDRNSADAFHLALKSSDFIEALNREMLTVRGLTAASYTLTIDDQPVGSFTKEQLSAGVNLATLPTPMLKQAQLVASLTQLRASVHNARWREHQVPLLRDKQMASMVPPLLKDLDAAGRELTRAQRRAAQPRPHAFVLVPGG